MGLNRDFIDLRDKNGDLLCLAWVSIPLVYTQLVEIVIHIYFLCTLFGMQYLQPTQFIREPAGTFKAVAWGTEHAINLVGYDETTHDMFIPLFGILKFIFYFGWLNVAETLINPFGEDDEDFDVNYLINRNLQIGYLMVEGASEEEDLEDPYQGGLPTCLPHTLESFKAGSKQSPGFPTDNMRERTADDGGEDEMRQDFSINSRDQSPNSQQGEPSQVSIRPRTNTKIKTKTVDPSFFSSKL